MDYAKQLGYLDLHCALTVVLLLLVAGCWLLVAGCWLLVAGYAVYQYYFNGSPNEVFFARQKVTDATFLYITRYNGGGATVSDVYRYYLDGNLSGDPVEHLKNRAPFLISAVSNAKVTGYGSHVNVTLTGRVYSFTNSDLFYSDGVAIMPVISFTANGSRYNSRTNRAGLPT
ncbi:MULTISPECIES: hypothetical protein [unclassified Cedecea]|uniref:hypothetical protein n=1 Tax=unclassified Cedecea TaxID=2649846 RepID=UPI00301B4E75